MKNVNIYPGNSCSTLWTCAVMRISVNAHATHLRPSASLIIAVATLRPFFLDRYSAQEEETCPLY